MNFSAHCRPLWFGAKQKHHANFHADLMMKITMQFDLEIDAVSLVQSL
jgi:hypothetical protein